MTEESPRRAYGITIDVQGDTWEDVAQRMRALLRDIPLDSVGAPPSAGWNGVALSAGYASSYLVDTYHDPTMTHDAYYAAIEARGVAEAAALSAVSGAK